MTSWVAHVAPKGLSPEILKRLLSTYTKVASTAEWREWCAIKGIIPTPEYIGNGGATFLDQDGEMQRPILEAITTK